MITRIVSGGQTGVDRAALDVALELKLPCGGWCPLGRKAEDGVLPDRYPLIDTPTDDYVERTTWNVRGSDGTLILNRGPLSGGTLQTAEDAGRLGKPCLVLQLETRPSTLAVRGWLNRHRIKTLNVAGPRESKCPGIYQASTRFLRSMLATGPVGSRPALTGRTE